MQIHSPEIKVGLFTLIALFALFGVFYWLSGSKLFQNGYEIEAVFDRIENLRPGSPVKLHGVDVGRISRVYFEDYKVIVAMRIRPQFKIPRNTKALIATAGVVGDQYLELTILKPGEPEGEGDRIKGQSPHTMDQLYATAYEVMASIKEIADSVKRLTNDQSINYLNSSIARIDRITANLENLTGGPETRQLIQNLTSAASELARAGNTANRFLSQVEANGETAAELQKILANAEKITANLDAIVAKNGPEVELLVKDARKTLQTINTAVENINKAVQGLSGEGDPSQVSNNIKAAAEAAGKISEYVAALEEFSIDNNVGAGHQDRNGLIVNYRMDVNLNKKNQVQLGVEDIGEGNLTSFQWGVKSPTTVSRFGLYRNEVGLGLDYLPTSNLTLGVDVWDTNSANLGLSSAYQFNEDWSVKLSAWRNWDTTERDWTVECWRKF